MEKQNREAQLKQEQKGTVLRQKEDVQGLEIHLEELQYLW